MFRRQNLVTAASGNGMTSFKTVLHNGLFILNELCQFTLRSYGVLRCMTQGFVPQSWESRRLPKLQFCRAVTIWNSAQCLLQKILYDFNTKLFLKLCIYNSNGPLSIINNKKNLLYPSPISCNLDLDPRSQLYHPKIVIKEDNCGLKRNKYTDPDLTTGNTILSWAWYEASMCWSSPAIYKADNHMSRG